MEYVIVFSLWSLGYGIYAFRRSGDVAERNREFIESGKETYFEQRRSWQAYGTTPVTDAGEVRRRGRREIILGSIGLFVVVPAFYFIDHLVRP